MTAALWVASGLGLISMFASSYGAVPLTKNARIEQEFIAGLAAYECIIVFLFALALGLGGYA